jgi:hypothetical protein
LFVSTTTTARKAQRTGALGSFLALVAFSALGLASLGISVRGRRGRNDREGKREREGDSQRLSLVLLRQYTLLVVVDVGIERSVRKTRRNVENEEQQWKGCFDPPERSLNSRRKRSRRSPAVPSTLPVRPSAPSARRHASPAGSECAREGRVGRL